MITPTPGSQHDPPCCPVFAFLKPCWSRSSCVLGRRLLPPTANVNPTKKIQQEAGQRQKGATGPKLLPARRGSTQGGHSVLSDSSSDDHEENDADDDGDGDGRSRGDDDDDDDDDDDGDDGCKRETSIEHNLSLALSRRIHS